MAVKPHDAPRVLETRAMGAHLRFRRYRKPNGRTFKTVEFPWSIWLQVQSTVAKRLPGFTKAEAARDRIRDAENLLAQGNKSEYVADVLGLTGQRVRQIKARMKSK